MSRGPKSKLSGTNKTTPTGALSQIQNVPAKFAARDIAELSRRIAQDNARVSRFMENLVNHVDMIVDAASSEDWPEVARQADYLAGCGASHGCTDLAKRAAELSETLKSSEAKDEIRRKVVRLVGACGRARQPDGK